MRDDIAMEVKPFIVLSAKGDLPTNPTSLRECLVCGGVFTHGVGLGLDQARFVNDDRQAYRLVLGLSCGSGEQRGGQGKRQNREHI
jgi:hypothetical protein